MAHLDSRGGWIAAPGSCPHPEVGLDLFLSYRAPPIILPVAVDRLEADHCTVGPLSRCCFLRGHSMAPRVLSRIEGDAWHKCGRERWSALHADARARGSNWTRSYKEYAAERAMLGVVELPPPPKRPSAMLLLELTLGPHFRLEMSYEEAFWA